MDLGIMAILIGTMIAFIAMGAKWEDRFFLSFALILSLITSFMFIFEGVA